MVLKPMNCEISFISGNNTTMYIYYIYIHIEIYLVAEGTNMSASKATKPINSGYRSTTPFDTGY